jgi:putative ABC transport system ATP-binding protein
LSGGEQQRVSIARAISKAPDILLCDEPTGALDSATGYHVIKLLHDICENENKTVFIVTHNEEFALISDKVIKLKDGKVVDVILNESPKSVDEIEW